MMVFTSYTLFFAVVASFVSVQAQKKKPNFVLIMTDDQGFDDYGFRQPPLETPNMDKLMKRGVQFTRFYTNPACAPTRAALLTGRNYMRTGTSAVGFGGDGVHLDEYMLGEALQDAGYVTGMCGKWNIGTSDAELPHRRGFNETWEVSGEDNRSFGRYEHFQAPFHHNGEYIGFSRGWQVERVTDRAIEFIERHKGEPFFLYLPYAQPHEPWLCAKELQQKYMKQGIGESYAMFLGMMEQLDGQVGRVMTALENNGLSQDTVLLFLGDNGPTYKTRLLFQRRDGFFKSKKQRYRLNSTEWAARNPSGFRDKKATAWENGIRNRLGVYSPGRFTPKQVHEMTLVMDIYPTILQLAGQKRKTDAPSLDGTSLRRFLFDEDFKWPKERKLLTGETERIKPHLADDGWKYRFTKNYSFPLDKRSSCFIQGDWVIVNNKGKFLLFDLSKDPRQKTDLRETFPEKFSQMQRGYYREWDYVRSDPHAWSDPVQLIGLPGVTRPYLEMEYIYRMRGKNDVWWSNTFFKRIGSTQELKVRVLQSATYNVSLRAIFVPNGTKVRLYGQNSNVTATLKAGEANHDLGQMTFVKGDQTMGLTVLDHDPLESLSKMQVYNIRLRRVD